MVDLGLFGSIAPTAPRPPQEARNTPSGFDRIRGLFGSLDPRAATRALRPVVGNNAAAALGLVPAIATGAVKDMGTGIANLAEFGFGEGDRALTAGDALAVPMLGSGVGLIAGPGRGALAAGLPKIRFARKVRSGEDLSPDQTVVTVDASKLGAAADKDERFRAAGGKIPRFKEFLKTGEPVALAEPALMSSGRVAFENGMNRFKALRELGVKEIPVAVDKSQVAEFQRRFGVPQGVRAPGFAPVAEALIKAVPPQFSDQVRQFGNRARMLGQRLRELDRVHEPAALKPGEKEKPSRTAAWHTRDQAIARALQSDMDFRQANLSGVPREGPVGQGLDAIERQSTEAGREIRGLAKARGLRPGPKDNAPFDAERHSTVTGEQLARGAPVRIVTPAIMNRKGGVMARAEVEPFVSANPSAATRAAGQGAKSFEDEFTIDALHATNKDFRAFDPNKASGGERGATFVTTDPATGNQFAQVSGGRIMPVKVRPGNTRTFNLPKLISEGNEEFARAMLDSAVEVLGKSRSRSDAVEHVSGLIKRAKGQIKRQEDSGLFGDERFVGFNQIFTSAINKIAKQNGLDTASVRGLSETGFGDSGTVMIFNPANIRSRFAQFDPARRGSADLLAANPASGGLIPALAQRQRESDAQRERAGMFGSLTPAQNAAAVRGDLL